MDAFLTLHKAASAEHSVKRSRFIGYASPVQTEQAAVAFVNDIRARHRDARHNVYAYSLREGHTQRYSDDGEPQGTAGMPVLDVLRKAGLTDCAVVVTRYFGGILLGTGGLVHAYSQAAKSAVEAAQIVQMSLCAVLCVDCDYSFYGKLPALLACFDAVTESTEYADAVKTVFRLPAQAEAAFRAELTEQSQGKISARKLSERFDSIG